MKYRIDAGDLWQVDGALVIARETTNEGVFFSDSETGEPRFRSHADLRALGRSGKVKWMVSSVETKVQSSIALLTEDDRKDLERKLQYVRVYERAPRGYRSGARLDAILDEVARERSDVPRPAQRTVKHWKSLLDDAGGNTFVLAKGALRQRRGKRHPLTFAAMAKFIDEKYLVLRGPSLAYVAREFRKEIRRLKEAYPDAAGEYVYRCENTLRNYVDSLDPLLVIARREGPAAAKRHARVSQQGPRYERPLQCVQIDTWKKHIIYVDRKGNPLGRLYIAAVIDCYSRVILGFYIGPEPPRAWTILQAIRNAMLPKDGLISLYQLESEYPAEGRFELACFDQGPENTNIAVATALGSLGTDIDYGPKGKPGDRGIIERFFGTMAQALIHRLPGSTFSDIQDRGDYDPLAHANMTAQHIVRRVVEWIVDEYHNTEHSELGDTPLNVLKGGIADHGVPPAPPPDELALLLCQRTTRTIQSEGIEWNNMFYYASELGRLKSGKRKSDLPALVDVRGTDGENTVEILFDDGNLGRIRVVDRSVTPSGLVECESRWPEYSEGLTMWQDVAIRRELKAQGISPTREALVNKKREMFVRADSNNLSRKRVNRQAALFQEPTGPMHGGALPGRSPAVAFGAASTGAGEALSSGQNQAASQKPPKVIPIGAREDLYGNIR